MSVHNVPAAGRMQAARYGVGFLVFPGFDALQLAVSLAAFRMAADAAADIPMLSLDGGLVEGSSRVAVTTRPVTADGFDTLLVLGGAPDAPVPRLAELADFAHAASALLRRVAAIGTGIHVLAQAGLLSGRHAAVGPALAWPLARAHPDIAISSRRLFIEDHGIWTAPDAASGAEMCLALIEEDFGSDVSRAIAPFLPIDECKSQYAASPGGEGAPDTMTERQRAERALQQVQHGSDSFEAIARATGFGNAETMCRRFLRLFGQPPQVIRRNARRGQRASDHRQDAGAHHHRP